MMLDKLVLALVIIGALNWGSIGIFQFDLVAALFGGQAACLYPGGPGWCLGNFLLFPRHRGQPRDSTRTTYIEKIPATDCSAAGIFLHVWERDLFLLAFAQQIL